MKKEVSLQELQTVYKEVPFETVKKIWAQNTTPMGVYIHSPFCLSECAFCFYKGRVPLSGEIERYYNLYLPEQIKKYQPVLERSKIYSWFFGGGTPSLMNPAMLRRILELLPDIACRGVRTFEIHPAGFNLQLLDILAEYNFNNIIIGVQSFNEDILRKTKRIPAAQDEVRKIIQEIQRRNMHAWLDVVGFINDSPEEIADFCADICLATELEPDEISIYVNYNNREKYDELAVSLYSTILPLLIKTWTVEGCTDEYVTNNPDEFKKNLSSRGVVRIFNKRNTRVQDDAVFIRYLYSGAIETGKNSVLGIGAYKNQAHGTMSCIVSKNYNYNYVEFNETWDPHFFVTYTSNFFKELKLMVKDMENLFNKTNDILKVKELSIAINDSPDFGLAKKLQGLEIASIKVDCFGNELKKKQFRKMINDYFCLRKNFIELSEIE
jgi:hypothetical protein